MSTPMADMPLHEACDAFDAMIGVTIIDDGTPVPIELDTIADDAIATGEVPIGRPIEVDGSPAEGGIAAVGSIVVQSLHLLVELLVLLRILCMGLQRAASLLQKMVQLLIGSGLSMDPM